VVPKLTDTTNPLTQPRSHLTDRRGHFSPTKPWRGEIREGKVVKTHDEALEEEKRARGEEEPEEDRLRTPVRRPE
jgi:hypothetical protein